MVRGGSKGKFTRHFAGPQPALSLAFSHDRYGFALAV